jgi:hypothetical protein
MEKVVRKIGRPATGEMPAVTICLPPALLARVESYRAEHFSGSRAATLRTLIEAGLDRAPATPKTEGDK